MYRTTINGASSRDILKALIAEKGPLLDVRRVDSEVIESYNGRVPDILLDLWDNYGVGAFAERRFRFVIPAEFAPALDTLFHGDSDFEGNCHVVAIGAFGDMMVWSEVHHLMFIGLPLAMVDAPFLNKSLPKERVDQIALDYILNADPMIFDTADDAGDPMFDRSVANLGVLAEGQVYGTPAAVTFNEPLMVEALTRVDAVGWLSEKFTGLEFMLADLASERINIRPIGKTREGGDAL